MFNHAIPVNEIKDGNSSNLHNLAFKPWATTREKNTPTP
jgi:hypothetical protein